MMIGGRADSGRDAQVLMLMAAADMNDDGGIQYGEFAEGSNPRAEDRLPFHTSAMPCPVLTQVVLLPVAVQLMAYVAREETIQAEMEN
eukprot:3119368-Rhodomonas_salina.1